MLPVDSLPKCCRTLKRNLAFWEDTKQQIPHAQNMSNHYKGCQLANPMTVKKKKYSIPIESYTSATTQAGKAYTLTTPAKQQQKRFTLQPTSKPFHFFGRDLDLQRFRSRTSQMPKTSPTLGSMTFNTSSWVLLDHAGYAVGKRFSSLSLFATTNSWSPFLKATNKWSCKWIQMILTQDIFLGSTAVPWQFLYF